MNIGISTACYHAKKLNEACTDNILSTGADFAEMFLNTFSEYDEAYVSMLAQRYSSAGIAVRSVHPMGTQYEPQLFSLLERPRNDAAAIFRRVLKAMQILGAGIYVMHGIANLGGVAKNTEYDRVARLLRELSLIAMEYGVTIAYENVSWCLFNTPDFAPRLLNACPNELLRFTLDIKQAARCGIEPLLFLKAMGDRLINVHICGYKLSSSGGLGIGVSPTMPQAGDFDFSALFNELTRMGYSGDCVLEVYSDTYRHECELEAAVKYLKLL